MSVDVIIDDVEVNDDVEGGQESNVDPEEYFAKNAFRIVYQTNNFLLPQLRDLIDKGEVLNLRPEYQRRLRWSTAQKSRLIESLLLNIPVPPVFLYESDAARYEVMDGQQRLNAVREFISGDFALSNLKVLEPLNGLRYSKCPPRIKRALDRASLSAIVLLLESEKEKKDSVSLVDIRRIIFERLNTGGTKLNPQEVRNSLNPGEFNKAIINLTRYDLFTKVFDIPPYTETDPNEYYENPLRQKNSLYATMGDCQLILRYFALRDTKNVRGSMKSMLDRAMELKITERDRQQLEVDFKERFKMLYDIFQGNPFALPRDEKGRTRVSAAIYDAAMVAVNDLWEDRAAIAADSEGVRLRMRMAVGDQEKIKVLTGHGNTAKAIKERISLLKSILREE